VVAGTEDVREGQQRRDKGRVGRDRKLDQGAVGERDPDGIGLRAFERLLVPEAGLRVGAGGLQALVAELAGVGP
jgi:hypothetical protein